MGLFGPFKYKTKKGEEFFLHVKERGKGRLFYFSKEPAGALKNLPAGYEVFENPNSTLPFLKKKTGGGMFSLFKSKKTQENQLTEATK